MASWVTSSMLKQPVSHSHADHLRKFTYRHMIWYLYIVMAINSWISPAAWPILGYCVRWCGMITPENIDLVKGMTAYTQIHNTGHVSD